jgi:hypothetical protein
MADRARRGSAPAVARDAEQEAHDTLLALAVAVDALVADREPAVA